MTPRFRPDNAPGYSADELEQLNQAWETLRRGYDLDEGDPYERSLLAHWEMRILAAFAQGARGAELMAWFYP